jgi:G8 domain
MRWSARTFARAIRPLTLLVLSASAAAPVAAQTHSHTASGLPHGIPDFCASATVTSARDGAWSSPTTWSPARVPVAGDRVSVQHSVTYDVVSSNALNCVEVRGQLAFRSNLNTRLTVGTLMVYPNALLQIGTPTSPVAPTATAEVVIADLPLDTTQDPEQFGIGLIGLGRITISGDPKTPFARLVAESTPGASSLSTDVSLTGWRNGDKLFLPDTRHLSTALRTTYVPQWEEPSVSSSAGSTVALVSPVAFLHEGARDGNDVLTFLPHVANLTRNVIIRSQNPGGTRGHILFATRAEVDVRYALLKDLGRTLVSPLDSTTFDSAMAVTHIGTNQIGRYSLHMHHVMGPTTPPADGYQYHLIGNVVDGGTKWGIAIHNTHFGLVQGNVVYNVDGNGIATEDGSETNNLIEKNFVGRMNGSGGRGDERGLNDLGWEGSGFWFRGTNNWVRDNVAVNVLKEYGFKYFPFYINTVKIPNFPGADTTVAGQFTSVVGNGIPIKEFLRNEVYGATTGGLTYWWLGTVANTPVANVPVSVVKDLHVWHVWDSAIFHYPANMLTIDGLVVRGKSPSQSPSIGFKGLDYYARNLLISNADIQGMAYGISPSTHSGGAVQVIQDSYLRNGVNIAIGTMWTSAAEARSIPPRKIVIRNVRFDTPVTGFPGVPLRALRFAFSPIEVRNLIQRDDVYVYEYNGVPSDNFKGFYSEQSPSFTVPVTVISPYNTHWVEGAPVPGLTNQQTWSLYGLAIGGSIAPCATTRPTIDGLTCAIPWAPPSTDGLGGTLSPPRAPLFITIY